MKLSSTQQPRKTEFMKLEAIHQKQAQLIVTAYVSFEPTYRNLERKTMQNAELQPAALLNQETSSLAL